MKRSNNKFRNNNNNGNGQIYSLNYKFDSSSVAGKCCGTALDLIKRYNELAKDAASNNDYVTAEVFRQYAEHYRKIVTEINEKKQQNRQFNAPQPQNDTEENKAQETQSVAPVEESAPAKSDMPVMAEKKSFTIVEIPHSEAETAVEATAEDTAPRKPKRVYRRKAAAAE